MAAKRKTLPKEMEERIKNGTLEEVQKLMEKCLPNAVDRSSGKKNIFGLDGIYRELAEWLLAYGADINQPDQFGYTPLHHQAMNRRGAEQVKLYLELGADVNQPSRMNGIPLHGAASHGSLDNVKILLEYGADLTAKDFWGNTPLETALMRCEGIFIIDYMDVILYLVKTGAPVTDQTRKLVKQIGNDLEFRRDSIVEEYIPQIDKALGQLYELFEVPPVPKRRFHDGISPIAVQSKGWAKQYQELWDYLVPGSGACKTVQGEVIRINGRVSYEILDNGGINWDKDFRAMLKALGRYLTWGQPLSEAESQEIHRLISVLESAKGWEEELNRLCELSVKWVLLNPEPIPVEELTYRRRNGL